MHDSRVAAQDGLNELVAEHTRALELLQEMLDSFAWVQDHDELKQRVRGFIAMSTNPPVVH